MASGQQITDYIQYGSGAPSGAPSLGVAGQWGLYQNTATGTFYYWDLLTSAWVALGGTGFAPSFVSKTANYTLTTTDTGILGDATSGAITLTLPTAVGSTAIYFLMKKDSSANTVTIATTSSQTINGATTFSLAAQYAGITVISDGANWRIVAQVPVSGGAFTPATARKAITAGDYGGLTTTTFTDLDATNLSITLTTGAHSVLIGVVANAAATAGNGTFLDLTIDGTRQGGTDGLTSVWPAASNAVNLQGISFTYLSTTLSAASHTFKVQYRVTGGTQTVYASTTVSPFIFYAIEQPF